jgi:cell division FtsZ-interacting protein ZapD
MICTAKRLLLVRASGRLSTQLGRYSSNYDEVFLAAHQRLQENGYATKFDLAALIGWKHVQNSPWMFRLYDFPSGAVEAATAAAFAPGLSDEQRIDALCGLPGYGRGSAFTSVLLAAWDPTRYGVFDKFVDGIRPTVVTAGCRCRWADLPTYFDHLRRLADELATATGSSWTPRQVDQAMYMLGGGK